MVDPKAHGLTTGALDGIRKSGPTKAMLLLPQTQRAALALVKN